MKNLRIFALAILITSFSFAQPVTFIAFGDWGREGKYGQQETADQMGIFASKNKAGFVLTLGDNIYEHGVTGIDDPKWKTSFEDVYTAASLQVPWYVTIGNHDYGLSVQAQIDYSSVSSRWKCPARYYSFETKIDDNTTVLMVIIDTSPFIESYKTDLVSNDELNEQSVADLKNQDTKLQLYWLDSVLTSSKAKWKIVAGHHPVYSGGSHGNTPEMIEFIKPLLEKNSVNMYLCGHDHDMQHLKVPGSNVNYFVSGAASKLRDVSSTEYTLFAKSANGFLFVKAENRKLHTAFIDNNGSQIYSYVIE